MIALIPIDELSLFKMIGFTILYLVLVFGFISIKSDGNYYY
jgi:hypothetical protein